MTRPLLNKTASPTLSERDAHVLWLLSRKGYRFLTCRHLAGLVFGSAEECWRRLSTLCSQGLTSRLYLPLTRREGWQEPIYTLASRGARILARSSGDRPRDLFSQIGPASYLFLAHQLAVSDIRYSLEVAVRGNRGVRLLCWRNEWELRSLARARAAVAVVADALFGLAVDGRSDYYFLEADRGTMRASAMREKFWGYIRLFREGLHRDVFRLPHFRVLVVTTTGGRRNGLAALPRDIGYCLNMFLFTTYEERRDGRTIVNVSPERILGPIWRKCNDEALHSLLD